MIQLTSDVKVLTNDLSAILALPCTLSSDWLWAG
jgi:hypothetical protein